MDSQGRPISIQASPKGQTREYLAQAAKSTYEIGTSQARMRSKLARLQEEELDKLLKERKKEKILGPVKAVTREVEGVVMDVSRVAGSLGGPLKGTVYPRTPTSIPKVPTGPSLDYLRKSTLPTRKGRGSNYYEQMRKLRRRIF